MKSWMVIGGITFLVAFLSSGLTNQSDRSWFNRLQRPNWLTFEVAIPFIWSTIFVCGGWSAYIIWETAPNTEHTWLLMSLYLCLETLTLAYNPVMCKLRSLKVGTVIGGTGAGLSIVLAIFVRLISPWAAVLLLPYIIWSPIGTYTTWTMIEINPGSE